MEKTILSQEQIRTEIYPRLAAGDFRANGLYICKSGPVAGSIGLDMLSEPAIDQTKLTVRMRISTPQLDRVNHVVNQDNIRLDYYRDNPTVLFGHGLEGITFPVAMSENQDGECTVSREPDGTYAVAHHLERNKLSMQMFDLVVQKFIRASSIGVTALEVAKGYTANGEEILFLDETLLNEWSYVVMGVNPGSFIVQKSMAIYQETIDLQCEAASRILNANKLDGQSIHPLILKSLKASLEVRPSTQGIETTPVEPAKENKTMGTKTLTKAQIAAMGPRQIMKSLLILKEYDEMTQGMLEDAMNASPDAAPALGPETEAGPVVDEDPVISVDLDDDTPLGAKVLRAIYENVNQLIDTSTKAIGPVEAPEVKDAVTELMNQMRELATSMEGVFASKYPELPNLSPSIDEPSDDVVKGFLCNSSRGRDQLQGLCARVDMIAKSAKRNGGKVSASHMKILSQTVSDMSRLTTQAKAYKPTAAPGVVDEARYKEAFEALNKEFCSLKAKLEEVPLPLSK